MSSASPPSITESLDADSLSRVPADYAEVFKAPAMKAARNIVKGKDAANRVTITANGTLDVAGLN